MIALFAGFSLAHPSPCLTLLWCQPSAPTFSGSTDFWIHRRF